MQLSPVTRSLFFSGMGSNDCLNSYLIKNKKKNSYLMPNFPTPSQFKAERFGDILENLTWTNGMLNAFQGRSEPTCSSVQHKQSPGAKFIYLDIAHIFDEIIANPASYGFTTLDKGCCGIGRNRGHISLVFPYETPCPNKI
ncbi:hypothetical protein HID58_005805 [Brassica napus]|uniref:Uncharacterized protein n=1 Tax=Brassica napus TaxID=3708 RepID=A0ABQ8E9L2_BRANA|nr:hypothetical protein HID58_005805 [Brassica napus]